MSANPSLRAVFSEKPREIAAAANLQQPGATCSSAAAQTLLALAGTRDLHHNAVDLRTCGETRQKGGSAARGKRR